MKRFLLFATVTTGLLVGCAKLFSEPVPTTVQEEVNLIQAQACINFPLGTEVPKAFIYTSGKWFYDGKIIAEVQAEDSGFYVCGSPEYIREIAALERHQ